MTDRLHIEITGDLPDAGKFGILASAEAIAQTVAGQLEECHAGLKLTVSVKAVRPSKKSAAPAALRAAE